MRIIKADVKQTESEWLVAVVYAEDPEHVHTPIHISKKLDGAEFFAHEFCNTICLVHKHMRLGGLDEN